MAGIQITDVTTKLMGDITTTVSTQVSSNKVSENADFSKALESANNKIDVNKELATNNKSTERSTNVTSTSRNDRIKEQSSENTSKIDDPNKKSEVANKIEDKASEVKDAIKDKFGLTDEELNKKMEELGIASYDLLNPTKLQDLIMAVSEVTDSISLITNADLYENVKTVMEVQNTALAELAEEFSAETSQIIEFTEEPQNFEELLNSSDVDGQIANADAGNGAVNSGRIQVEVNNETLVNAVADNADVDSEAKNNVTETVQTVNNEVDSKTADNNSANTVNDENTSNENYSKMPTADEAGRGRNEGFENSSRFSENDGNDFESLSQNVAQTETVTTTQVNSVGDIIETVTSYTTNDSGEILNQITQAVRVNITEDVTSLEMQLNPASLGHVNMQVASNNGIVTANILVESEAVKVALESQLIALQESFNEAGQKVEAVEVSVANYDLSRGMNQEQRQEQGNKDHEEAFRVMGSRRRINLNLLDEIDDEELSEEEAIAKDMMEKNGNTVDMTV